MERCETCLGWHMKEAVRLGAKKDELVEATPASIRLRKELLTENARKKAGRKKATEEMVEV